MNDNGAVPLFDPDHPPTAFHLNAPTVGEQLRDVALQNVADHADVDWISTAIEYIRRLPAGVEFTADDVWQHTESENAYTHEPRALGAITRRLALAGEIVSTQRYRPSTRSQCHARPVLIWRRA